MRYTFFGSLLVQVPKIMDKKKFHFYQVTPEEFKKELLCGFDAKLIEFLNTHIRHQKESEELLTVEETLNFLKCSKQALYNWRKNGILPSYRLGNRVYYKKSDILAKLIKQN